MSASVLVKRNSIRWTMERFVRSLQGILHRRCHVVRKVIIEIREGKLPDPKVMGNAGSFFMNPIVAKEKLEALQQEYPGIPYYELPDGRVKIPAGWMIDQCGWKGKSLGPAAVHDKQALVLVNRGGAKGSDIVALSDAVRASVRDKVRYRYPPGSKFVCNEYEGKNHWKWNIDRSAPDWLHMCSLYFCRSER